MPRIKNISQDELRRMFEAPEISKPVPSGPTPQEFLSLTKALEDRKLQEKEREGKIAKIEQAIAKAEQEKQLAQTMQPIDATRTIGTAMGGVPTSQIASPADQSAQVLTPGQSVLSQEQPIVDAQQAEDIEAQRALIDPTGLAKERAGIDQKATVAEQSFQNQLELLREAARLRRTEEKNKLDAKGKTAAQKISALGNSKIFATEGFANLVSELKSGEKFVPKGIMSRIGLKADSLTSGNFSDMVNKLGRKVGFEEIIKSRPEAVLFDQQRESLAVAVYKFVSGDVGNIAATESKRALRLIPGVLDTPEVRAVKIAALERAVQRSKEALQTLINDPQSALLSPKELEARQKAIADEALLSASAEIADDPSMVELYEASQEAPLRQDQTEGLSPEEAAELAALQAEFGGGQ